MIPEQILTLIRTHCGDFLEKSKGSPLIKGLPNEYGHSKIVKVRKKKRSSIYDELFNSGFASFYPNLRERSIFAGSIHEGEGEQYYIFPPDGFKYIYNVDIKDSRNAFANTFSTIYSNCSSPQKSVADIINLSYVSTNLYEGLRANTEIIIFKTPYYIAIKNNMDYTKLLNQIKRANKIT